MRRLDAQQKYHYYFSNYEWERKNASFVWYVFTRVILLCFQIENIKMTENCLFPYPIEIIH